MIEGALPDHVNYFYKEYRASIKRMRKYNRNASLIVGFSGTWWLWFFGLILALYHNNLNLLGIAILSFVGILYFSYAFTDLSFTNIKWIVRIIGIYGIYQLHLFNINITLSILFYTFGVIFQDLMNPITKRAVRTQRFVSQRLITNSVVQLISNNTEYLNNRLNWAIKTAYAVLILGVFVFLFSQIINSLLLQNRIIIEILQVFSFIALVGIFIYVTPKLFPKINKEEII